MDIKDRLTQAMKINNINARELARLSGLSEATISRYLSGQMEPRANAVGKMAKALRVEPVWLMCLDDIEIEIEPITQGLNAKSIERLKSYADYLRSVQDKEDDT